MSWSGLVAAAAVTIPTAAPPAADLLHGWSPPPASVGFEAPSAEISVAVT